MRGRLINLSLEMGDTTHCTATTWLTHHPVPRSDQIRSDLLNKKTDPCCFRIEFLPRFKKEEKSRKRACWVWIGNAYVEPKKNGLLALWHTFLSCLPCGMCRIVPLFACCLACCATRKTTLVGLCKLSESNNVNVSNYENTSSL
uniref:Uncharacterized protein n=1 Tax=Aegilops tauschii subsp. strangulata TaxID=200361 RepID=A0A453IKN9_AEGTS